jgi:predicted acetyltransferase
VTGDGVRLRPLRPEDEVTATRAHEELAAEGFAFLLDRDRVDTWDEYLDLLDLQHRGRDPRPDRVPASFLAVEVDGELVGRVSVRHRLNAFLAHEGGHVGYAIRPSSRRRGYATEVLQLAVADLHDRGERPVLAVCDADNDASRVVIERCGGKLVDRRTRRTGEPILRFHLG